MYLGIDCGGTHLRLGLVEESGNLIAHSRTKSPLVSTPDKFGAAVFSEYQNLLATCHLLPTTSPLAIGVGVPGPIDRDSGSILHSANLHNDSPIHFVRQLETAFSSRLTANSPQISPPDFSNSLNNPQPPFVTSTILNHPPIYFDRDAEVALLGESWQGAAKDCQNCLMLTLGTGIGGAMMTNGKIISGVSDNAGEIGHMYLSVQSSEFIRRLTDQSSSKKSKMHQSLNNEQRTQNDIPICGLGHQGCFEAWLKHSQAEDKPYILGLGLASLVDIFNPAKIILGGGMIEYDEIDLAEVISIMQDKAVKPLGHQTEVVKAFLGDRAGVVGAAYLCIKKP